MSDYQDRDTANGQYAPTGMENLCVCGHRLGIHTAGRRTHKGKRYQQCLAGEITEGPRCACECYKKARAPK